MSSNNTDAKFVKNLFYKCSFLMFFCTSLILGGIFVSYLANSSIAENIDTQGWFFYIAASVSWAAVFALLTYLPPTIFYSIVKRVKSAIVMQIVLTVLLIAYFVINGMIYAQYRFHINGFVLEMLFSEGAGDIFQFNADIYMKLVIGFLGLILGVCLIWILCRLIVKRWNYVAAVPILTLLLGALVFSNIFHAYANVVKIPSVIRSTTAVPYYFPLTANRLLLKMGVVSKEKLTTKGLGNSSSLGLKYPGSELIVESDSVKKNIVMIIIDSWNPRSWTPEVFPNVWNFSSRCHYFADHLSSSNGTTGSTFGIFFSLPSYFRNDIESSGTQPLLVEELLAQKYDMKIFSSATLVFPPFARMIFANVPNLRIESKGETVYERDCEITDEFVSYIENRDTTSHFYSLLFYDLAHGYQMPKEKTKQFQPSWEYANYLELNNNTDPIPFWNLYRNCLFQIDSLVGRVINVLDDKKLLDNTIVIITGDHGQEFNENKKNYWGHNSNYSPAQIRVPLMWFDSELTATVHCHRTTHYDIATTLLKEVLGIQNPTSDLGIGHLLTDSCSRDWHIVGDNTNYAFIREDDNTIIEKKYSGYIDVYDSLMNVRDDYEINTVELNNVIINLNKLYK